MTLQNESQQLVQYRVNCKQVAFHETLYKDSLTIKISMGRLHLRLKEKTNVTSGSVYTVTFTMIRTERPKGQKERDVCVCVCGIGKILTWTGSSRESYNFC